MKNLSPLVVSQTGNIGKCVLMCICYNKNKNTVIYSIKIQLQYEVRTKK